MLTPKQLLAETAKFFSLHPERFITGNLVNRGSLMRPREDTCFCTVGYMAHRLVQEGVPEAASRPYETVANFFKGRFGGRAGDLYRQNDALGKPERVVKFLKEQVNEFDS